MLVLPCRVGTEGGIANNIYGRRWRTIWARAAAGSWTMRPGVADKGPGVPAKANRVRNGDVGAGQVGLGRRWQVELRDRDQTRW